MTAIVESRPLQKNVKKARALLFIDGIDSAWKGFESLAIWLIKKIKPQTVVDLGFHRALSTVAFAFKNNGHVFGIDWFEEEDYAQKVLVLDGAFQKIAEAIRCNYVKNVHLIIGPPQEVANNWKREIDILHIDRAQSYESIRAHFERWGSHLRAKGVLLIHDIDRFSGVNRFYQELPGAKIALHQGGGMGIISQDAKLIAEISAKYVAEIH